ncbi:MAG: nuclear transport factor 2 family protein [Pseudomonadota bacterium]
MVAEPIDRQNALRLVADVEEAFGTRDIDRIMSGFTDDITVRFADQPEIQGKEAVRRFLEARFGRQKGYKLTKTLRMVDGDMIGNYWFGDWEDAFTGKQMSGRGTEFWTVRDGKVAVWEAAFSVWDRNAPTKPPCSA